MMQASTTIFTVGDVAASRDYFRDRLGFKVAFEWGQPVVYVGLFADNIRLHLSATGHARRPPGHCAMTIDVDDVDGLYGDLTRRGAKIVRPPKDEPYGMRVLDVADLDGNMLFFGTELKTAQR
jgi:catechol 2,3-dioxygenase-like lactoylglutathione lyase family enzyme